ncbi:WS/DGAT domain-containing protein [Rhodococcus sp. CSLK01-03]|uniref:WS/DGAT domain-containing protein n=1 Tax=Rhodococcus indonesiensis TaxID=3055869 RepID=A0ABT7RKV9_9NOCA|nr:WS/DGAT domain-containing protein [Rhodococcus indonesiensis]MDM7487631.1 WS/DGAT domain-containing protein [Rhodococcus indonesiensis]
MSIRQWRHARLTWADAANYYESKPGRPTDWSAFVVFDEQGGTVRGPGDALAHLRSRAHLLTALDRRIVEAPGRLDYPYWVRAQLPPEQRIEYREWAGRSFTDCIDAIADLCADPLDVRRRAWCLHVFAGVSDPDDPTATVTVVVLQVSHAVMAGSALGAFLGALFGADGQPLRVPGLAPAATRPHHVAAAVSGVARSARWYLGLGVVLVRRAASARSADIPAVPSPAARSMLSLAPGRDRVIRIVRPDLGSLVGRTYTVTAMGLAAVSLALQRYLGEHGAPVGDVHVAVPVAVGAAGVALGVNRLTAAIVPLCTEVADPRDRVAAVADALAHERRIATSPEVLDRLAGAGAVPYPVYRRAADRHDRAASAGAAAGPARTAVTSVDCGAEADWSYGGSAFRFVAGIQSLRPGMGLVHSSSRAGDSFAVTVMSSPLLMPDLDRYATLLEEGFAEVIEATGGRRSGTGRRGRG